MTVLYAAPYMNCMLFLVEHNGKYLELFRKFAENEVEIYDVILPFNGLKNSGQINFEMFYNGKWIPHNNNMDNFGLSEKMNYLQILLKEFRDYEDWVERNYLVCSSNRDTSEEQRWLDFVEDIIIWFNRFKYFMQPLDLAKDF